MNNLKDWQNSRVNWKKWQKKGAVRIQCPSKVVLIRFICHFYPLKCELNQAVSDKSNKMKAKNIGEANITQIVSKNKWKAAIEAEREDTVHLVSGVP